MKVSILVFPGVEELDFVGFLEPLAVANRVVGKRRFETELVGTSKEPIVCSGGMKIVPDRTLANSGRQDLVFVPGGGAKGSGGVRQASNDQRVLNFLSSAAERGEEIWSVCTGALVLGSAGLLKGKRAVTHQGYLRQLEEHGAKVASSRVVSDGRITTGGGISSSIDVGLELVRRSLGERVARQVVKRMEYYPPRVG